MTSSFQSFSRGGQFQASQVDLGTQQIEQQNAQIVRDLERQSADLLARDKQKAREFEQGAQGLAQFSTSLADVLIERKKKQNEEEMLEGMRQYWFNGATEEETAEFKAGERSLAESRSAADQAADEYEAGGGDVFVGEKLREMSGWKAFGFAKAMLQQAGVSYGSYYTQQAQTLGLNETNDPRERAAIEQQIREQYMMQYKDLNPMLLHENLFPSMRKFEQAEQLAYANRQARLFQKARENARKQDLYATFVDVDPTKTAENLMAWVDQYKGQYGGDSKLAYASATELIRTGVTNGSIDPDKFLNALDAQVTRRDGATMSLRDFRSNDFATLEQAAMAAQTVKLNRSIEFQKNTDRQAYIAAREEWMASDRSEEALLAIRAKYRFNDPAYAAEIGSWVSNEDYDDQLIIQDIEARRNAGLPIPLDFVNQISDATKREAQMQLVTNDDKVNPPESIVEDHQAKIEAAVKDVTGIFEYDSRKNIYATQNAMAEYRARYKAYRDKGISVNEAAQLAYQEVVKMIPESFKDRTGGFFNAPEFKRQSTNIAMFQDLNKRAQNGKLDFDSKIEGVQDQVAQLNDSLKSKSGITDFWRTLADRYGVDVYTLINTQLRAYGYEEFNVPKTYSDIEQYPRDTRRLIQFHKTMPREYRAASTQENAKWFLDSIASVESRTYGEYEAFNRGGRQGGHVPIGSGNSTTQLEKPITKMTIGEIKKLQALPANDPNVLHAVGRYQFIGPTFLETANLIGVSDDQVFDEDTQDLFALTRAAVRIREMNGGSVAGLSAEWIGLTNLPTEQVQKMVAFAKNLPDYMKLHTLLPGVAMATLKPN